MSRARELLQQQVSAGVPLSQIAEQIGYSRPAVSLYARGKYERDCTAIEAALLRAFDTRECPYTGETVTPETCTRKALSPRPFGGRARLAWWTCCQTCPHRPEDQPK